MSTQLRLRYFLTFWLLSTTITGAFAQQFGGNPPSVKWRQVNTPAVKVIFSQGLDSVAFNIAGVIDRVNPAVQPTIGNRQKKVSLVLQDKTTIPNAYVGLAPFRSEFYLTPDQNSFELGSLPWADQLAIHEYRHVQQYNNFNVGLSRVLSTIFGQGGQAVANSLSVPDWFFEGDAVYNETLVSRQGRGRLPYFYNGYRALWAANKNYSWMKLRNGSYKDYIPDWYPMGYMLVSYGREKYGNELWRNVTHDAAAFNSLFYPMQHAVKKYTGKDFKTFRTEGLNYFKQQYQYKSIIQSSNNSVINNEFPAFVDENTLIYVTSAYDKLPQFTLNKNGVETKVSVRSRSLDNYFDYRNGKVVYAAYRPDLRWTYRDYSELRVLDISTGKERQLTRSTKYFAPAFNADGTLIVAVKTVAGQSWLHILDAATGKVIDEIPNPDKLFYTYPKFYNTQTLVAAVRNSKGEMTLAFIDIKTGVAKYLLPWSFNPIGFIAVNSNKIYFSATAGKNDRLFSFYPATARLLEFKSNIANLNQYQPAVSGSKLAWVEFTVYGYKVNEATSTSSQWIETPQQTIQSLSDFNISVLAKDSSANLLGAVSTPTLAVSKYSKAHGLFNFHSLIPDFSDPNYSLTLTGENVLNTFRSEVSFNYNRDEGSKQFGFAALYGGLFPFIRGGVNYTLDRRSLFNGERIYFNEKDVYAGLQLPLNLSNGKNVTSLSAGSDVYYTSNTIQDPFRTRFRDRNYTYLSHSISFSNRIQQAKQHIYPRFGQNISLSYRYAISSLTASQFLANGTLFLPGVLRNHNLVINVAHQEKGQSNAVNFSNNFPFSRGYTAENLQQMNKIGVNYHLPLFYPDAGLAQTVYFMRVRANLFYDYTRAQDTFSNGKPFNADFRTAGAELYFDTKWFNQHPLTFGVRYSYLLDNDIFGGLGKNRIELILPVSFF
ncbi:hypothetical protein ACFQZS_07930 [Mucilaginibacter calamicampi]|uniref:WD40-like Beta Propeller Repeat n=1 Tax=Mucilaginibacter calamicampi TaxID=1302352 RepID=A0ABW2YZW7_9SPHI